MAKSKEKESISEKLKSLFAAAEETPSDDFLVQTKRRGRPRKDVPEPQSLIPAIVMERSQNSDMHTEQASGRLSDKAHEKKEAQKAEMKLAAAEEPHLTDRGEEMPKPMIIRKTDAKYSDEDLEMFKKIIQAERFEAVEEFQILREQLEDMTNSEMADENASYSMHMAEQGTQAQEKEKIYAQVQRLNDYIKKLDDALQRIEEKTYGICRMCGCLIAKERLIAVPITTLSASYKIHKICPADGIDRIIAPSAAHA